MTNLAELIPRVMESYLDSARKSGDSFWSVRELARRFDCSEYTALAILRKLTDQKFIKRIPGKGSFLCDHVDINLLAMTVARKHLGMVLPHWGRQSADNFWTDYNQLMAAESRRMGWDATFYGESVEWGDVSFVIRFKMAGCNLLIAVDPGESALITFTELCRAGIPVLAIGPHRKGYEKLGVVTLDRDEKEAMRTVLLCWFKQGIVNPAIVGNSGRYSIHQRYEGCAQAFKEARGTRPGDIFIEEPADLDELLLNLRHRLEGTHPPDAVIFNESLLFEMAMADIPHFERRVCAGLKVAVFDELHASAKWPDLGIVKIQIPVKEIVRRTVDIVKSLSLGKPVAARTLIPASIEWGSRPVGAV